MVHPVHMALGCVGTLIIMVCCAQQRDRQCARERLECGKLATKRQRRLTLFQCVVCITKYYSKYQVMSASVCVFWRCDATSNKRSPSTPCRRAARLAQQRRAAVFFLHLFLHAVHMRRATCTGRLTPPTGICGNIYTAPHIPVGGILPIL